MIAAMHYSKSDGISKKICMQACALSAHDNASTLLCLGKFGIQKIEYANGTIFHEVELQAYRHQNPGIGEINYEKDLIREALKEIQNNKYQYAYIRHMIPLSELIELLKILKKNGSVIAYEIPTYPYYYEQMNVSNNKLKTVVKLGIETIFWPVIYRNVDTIPIIKCNSKAKIYQKMIEIHNGIDREFHLKEDVDLESLSIIGVGTIYPYHGYDRIIEAIKKCGGKFQFKGKSINVKFYIVGESEEISRLKKISNDIKLNNHVIFCGKKYGEDLAELYRSCNLGAGTLCLSKRNANIDTGIKNIEYFAYDLPAISSGKIFDIPKEKGLYLEYSEGDPINFSDIYSFVRNYYSLGSRKETMEDTLHTFEWTAIMSTARTKAFNMVKNG